MTVGYAEDIDRAERAKAELALTREAFEDIRQTCLARILEVTRKDVTNSDAVKALAMAINVADDIEAILKAHVHHGELAEAGLQRLRKVEQMSPAKRRYADALG